MGQRTQVRVQAARQGDFLKLPPSLPMLAVQDVGSEGLLRLYETRSLPLRCSRTQDYPEFLDPVIFRWFFFSACSRDHELSSEVRPVLDVSSLKGL